MKKSMKLYMKIINNEWNIERYFVDGMELIEYRMYPVSNLMNVRNMSFFNGYGILFVVIVFFLFVRSFVLFIISIESK